VHRAKIFGRCEPTTGIAPFDRLVAQVMTIAPYRTARRVFWIVDNGSSHRGARAVARLQQQYPNLVLVQGPVHASWRNQIEIYFSIVQRKVLTPNDFASLAAVEAASWPFSGTTKPSLARLSGPAVDTTWPGSLSSLPARHRRRLLHESSAHIRVRTYEMVYLGALFFVS
jgi:hypothetical protein